MNGNTNNATNNIVYAKMAPSIANYRKTKTQTKYQEGRSFSMYL